MNKGKDEVKKESTPEITGERTDLDRPIRFVEREVEFIGKISKGTGFDEIKEILDEEKMLKMANHLDELIAKYGKKKK